MSRDDLALAVGHSNSGTLTKRLDELESCGFVRRYLAYGKKRKGALYQLIDNFVLFHERFVHPDFGDEHLWSNLTNSPRRNAWCGLAFERVCLEHVPQIKRALGISGVQANVRSWNCKGDEEIGINGSQIDLLIDRKDQVINVCEMKYATDLYALTKAGGRPCATRYMTSRPSRVPKRRSRNADHDIWPQGERPCRHVPVGRDGKGPVRLRDVLSVHV